jgi:hypothetical protein
MALNFRPWLDQPPPHYHSRHRGARIGQLLGIAVTVALVVFLGILITAIVTASGG